MKKTNILNDKETFLSAKSWIFTSVILWGADNKIEKKVTLSQKTNFITISLSYGFPLLICSVLD
jgi:hypothetical protein